MLFSGRWLQLPLCTDSAAAMARWMLSGNRTEAQLQEALFAVDLINKLRKRAQAGLGANKEVQQATGIGLLVSQLKVRLLSTAPQFRPCLGVWDRTEGWCQRLVSAGLPCLAGRG